MLDIHARELADAHAGAVEGLEQCLISRLERLGALLFLWGRLHHAKCLLDREKSWQRLCDLRRAQPSRWILFDDVALQEKLEQRANGAHLLLHRAGLIRPKQARQEPPQRNDVELARVRRQPFPANVVTEAPQVANVRLDGARRSPALIRQVLSEGVDLLFERIRCAHRSTLPRRPATPRDPAVRAPTAGPAEHAYSSVAPRWAAPC